MNTPPLITVQPGNIAECTGDNVQFNITATGTTPLSYMWLKNGDALVGDEKYTVSKDTLILDSISVNDSGVYRCIVSNLCGSVTSDSVQLTVNSPIVISQQPENIVQCKGEIAQFNISVNGTSPLVYQWFKNDTAISGANQDTLKFCLANAQNINNDTKLLLHMDGANSSTNFIDATGKTVTDHGVLISNSVYKFGNGSGYFEGGNYLYIPANSAFDFGTGDFTIDFWADPISFPATYTVFFETGNYILNSGILLQYSKGSQQMQVYLNGRTDYFNINGIDIPTGVWQHLRIS